MDIEKFIVLIEDDLNETKMLIEKYLIEKDEKLLKKIFKLFHSIKGIAGFTELEIIYELTKYTEKLIEVIIRVSKQDEDLEIYRQLIILLIRSYELVKNIIDDRFRMYNDGYIKNVMEHIDSVSSSIEEINFTKIL